MFCCDRIDFGERIYPAKSNKNKKWIACHEFN